MRVFSALLIVLLIAASSARATQWPDVIDKLAQAKSKAELCAGLLKSRTSGDALDSAKMTYGLAKVKADGVVAGLEGVLFEGGRPERLPEMQEDLADAGAKLQMLCDAAVKTSRPNTMGVYDEMARGAVEPLIKAISEGVAGLWNWAMKEDDITRQARKTRLEAAAWLPFEKIDVH